MLKLFIILLGCVLTGCNTTPVMVENHQEPSADVFKELGNVAKFRVGMATTSPPPVLTAATAPVTVASAASSGVFEIPVEVAEKPVAPPKKVIAKEVYKATSVIESLPMIVKSKDIVIVTDAEGKVSRTETIHEVTILEQLSAMWMSLASILGGLFATYTGYQKWRESRVIASPKIILD